MKAPKTIFTVLLTSVSLFEALSAIPQGAPPPSPSAPSAASWTLQQANVVASERLDKGALVTVRIALDDPQGPKGHTYLTPQSPFVISKSGKPVFWTAWMNLSPQDNKPVLWLPLTPGSIEIEINKRVQDGKTKIINTRAVKDTQLALKTVASDREIHYIDDNTVEVTLFFDVPPEDIADVGFIAYCESCNQERRNAGVGNAAIAAWKPQVRQTATPSASTVGLRFDVKQVSVLPQLGSRYQTMKLLSSESYQRWEWVGAVRFPQRLSGSQAAGC